MGRNENRRGNLTKSYTFKVHVGRIERRMLVAAINEQQGYRDRLSRFIASHLVDMRIGDLVQYFGEGCEGNAYYVMCSKEGIRELPLYRIFTKSFPDSNSRNNALFEWIRHVNPEGYSGNSIGLSETYYRRNGYFKSVVGNYVTKMSSLRPNVRKRYVDECSSEEEIEGQVIYEMLTRNYGGVSDFDSLIAYLGDRGEECSKALSRFVLLRGYLASHEETVKEKAMLMGVESIQSYEGLRIGRDRKSMTLNIQNYTISRDDGTCTYRLRLPIGRKCVDIPLWGNRQVVRRVEGGGVEEIVDVAGSHGESLTFVLKGGRLYFTTTVTVPYEKREMGISKVVGCDVNTKHMLLQTDIVDDGRFSGYVNIYRALADDLDFSSILTESERKQYAEMARFVSFFPVESETLFARYCKNKGLVYDERELRKDYAIGAVLRRMRDGETDADKFNYLSYVLMLRTKVVSQYVLKAKYNELQAAFDLSQGHSDGSHLDSQFSETREAREILDKMERTSRDVMGLRDNILCYAYRLFVRNGYDTVSLEQLESSQFEVGRIVSPKSIMDYHGMLGKTMDDVVSGKGSLRFSFDDYDFRTDAEGKVCDVAYSAKGNAKRHKFLFANCLIKAIHFADLKDKFVQMSNDGRMNVITVPSFFSSQMDSDEHVLYCERKVGKDGKKVLSPLPKRKVRSEQEWYLPNGKNADFNSARNLSYIASDETMRGVFCVKPKNTNGGYCTPLMEASTRNQIHFVKSLEKLGKVRVVEENETVSWWKNNTKGTIQQL